MFRIYFMSGLHDTVMDHYKISTRSHQDILTSHSTREARMTNLSTASDSNNDTKCSPTNKFTKTGCCGCGDAWFSKWEDAGNTMAEVVQACTSSQY